MKYSKKTGKVTIEYDARYCLPVGDYIWYDIPGFPSYQYSPSGYIRSFKSRRKFPCGQILMFKHTVNNGDVFTLSDYNNIVRELSFDKIKEIVESQKEFLHPYHTYEVPRARARNQRAFIDSRTIDANGKIVRKPKPKIINGQEAETFMPTFSLLSEYPVETPHIVTPIHFI